MIHPFSFSSSIHLIHPSSFSSIHIVIQLLSFSSIDTSSHLPLQTVLHTLQDIKVACDPSLSPMLYVRTMSNPSICGSDSPFQFLQPFKGQVLADRNCVYLVIHSIMYYIFQVSYLILSVVSSSLRKQFRSFIHSFRPPSIQTSLCHTQFLNDTNRHNGINEMRPHWDVIG